jgi:myo-inositol 2-dehydrogenase / D-chiro-inositol 1-dehydrogenase
VMQILYAAYASAGLGQKVELPYKAQAKTPIDEWLSRKEK